MQKITDVEQLEVGKPLGAIENGREFFRRLEEFYYFHCDDGALVDCPEWAELKKCFEHLVKHIETIPSPEELQSLVRDAEKWREQIAPEGNDIEELDKACKEFNEGKIDLVSLVCRVWNGGLKAGMEEQPK